VIAIDVVTFDLWATLIRPANEVSQTEAAWTAVVCALDPPTEPVAIPAATAAAWQAMVDAWHTQQPFTVVNAAAHFLSHIGLESRGDAEEIASKLAEVAGTDRLRLAPGAIGCLRELVDSGVRVGVICDVGFTPSHRLRAELDRLGVAQYVSHWSFSDQTRLWKPAQELFVAVQGTLGAPAARCAHVGDSRRTDVDGARRAGWRSVRYAEFNDDRSPLPDADHVVPDMATLRAVLAELCNVRWRRGARASPP
jgi:FMN phosphatase YigB (HAD superfamily)